VEFLLLMQLLLLMLMLMLLLQMLLLSETNIFYSERSTSSQKSCKTLL
jgi:hypothetical protein